MPQRVYIPKESDIFTPVHLTYGFPFMKTALMFKVEKIKKKSTFIERRTNIAH